MSQTNGAQPTNTKRTATPKGDNAFQDFSADGTAAQFREVEFNVEDLGPQEIEREIKQLSEQIRRIDANIDTTVVGMRQERLFMMISPLLGRHILLEGTPGTAKTLLCKSFADTLGLSFQRIQFTPDLTANDIVGFQKPNGNNEFEFQKGPIFAHVVLADEINRSPGKTQSALLQAMQEGQVTVDRETYDLPKPFLVMATQNPLEKSSSTYPLPDAQLDRFGVKMTVNYPSRDETREILMRDTRTVKPQVECLYSESEARSLFMKGRELIRGVQICKELYDGVVSLGYSLRPEVDRKVSDLISAGPSVRGLGRLLEYAQGVALLAGRSHVLSEDIQRVAIPVLRHRIEFREEDYSTVGKEKDKVIHEAIDRHIMSVRARY